MSEITSKPNTNNSAIAELIESAREAKRKQAIAIKMVEALYPEVLQALNDFTESIINCTTLEVLTKLKKQKTLHGMFSCASFPEYPDTDIGHRIVNLISEDGLSVDLEHLKEGFFLNWKISLINERYYNDEFQSAVHNIGMAILQRTSELEELKSVISSLKNAATKLILQIDHSISSNALENLTSLSGCFELESFYDSTKAFLEENNVTYSCNETKDENGVTKYLIYWEINIE